MATRKILVAFVVVFVSLSSSAFAQRQPVPEEMTGFLRVNGKDSGTAFLVADRVIITCAHCLYNPPHGFSTWPIHPSMVEYLPRKTIGPKGQAVSRGSIRGMKIVWEGRAWHHYADDPTALNNSGSSEYKERSRLDYAIILLSRTPTVRAHFIPSADDVPEEYVSGNRKIWELGYPRIAGGKLWGGTVAGAEFHGEREWFSADGLNATDSQGMSGGPFFYRNAKGKWVAFAIHNYAGSMHSTHWIHRRFTPEIVYNIELLARK